MILQSLLLKLISALWSSVFIPMKTLKKRIQYLIFAICIFTKQSYKPFALYSINMQVYMKYCILNYQLQCIWYVWLFLCKWYQKHDITIKNQIIRAKRMLSGRHKCVVIICIACQNICMCAEWRGGRTGIIKISWSKHSSEEIIFSILNNILFCYTQ